MKEPAPELIVRVDGGARGNPGPAAAGIVICEPSGRVLLEAGYWLGHLTNNQAEYQALLKGLEAAARWDVGKLTIYSDSELMVRQLLGTYKVRSPELKPLFEQVLGRLGGLTAWTIQHVVREKNTRADELVNEALDKGRDVVKSSATDGALEPKAGLPVEEAPIYIQVSRPCSDRPCSPGCANEKRFTLKHTLPTGLTLEVAAKMIAAVKALRSQCGVGGDLAQPQRFTCNRCGAVFRVSLVEHVNH